MRNTSRQPQGALVTNDINENAAIVDEYNDYLFTITNLHQIEPEPINWQKVQEMRPPFSPNEIGPRESAAKEALENFQPNMMERLFNRLAQRKQAQLKEKMELSQQEDQANYNEWKELTALATRVLRGDEDAYKKVLIETSDFAEQLGEDFQVRMIDSKKVEIDLVVKVEEVIPDKTLTLTKTGRLSRRAMGKMKYVELMKDHVCSRALWTARHLFAFLPITQAIVHFENQMLNTATGHEEKMVILSVVFDKQTVNNLNFQRIHPSDAIENFPHHIDHLKTKGFRPVERMSIRQEE